MDGINASGKRVSLLNDDAPAYWPYRATRLSGDFSPRHRYSSSRNDSETSSQSSRFASPTHSPSSRSSRETPRLLRYSSTSSQNSLDSPSPMTPTSSFEPSDYHHHQNSACCAASQASIPSQQPYYGAPAACHDLVIVDDVYQGLAATATQFRYATEPVAPIMVATPSPSSPLNPLSPGSPSSAASPAKTVIVRKKYPCPHAARFACFDTFTTSGHAARHGKKHTGEKNILCPTCGKAFTRKDNMKQHERTHKTGRESIPGPLAEGAPISSRRAGRSSDPSSSATEMEVDDPAPIADATLRPSHPVALYGSSLSGRFSPLSSDFSLGTAPQPRRPDLGRHFSGESQDGEGESPGLDALAMAALG